MMIAVASPVNNSPGEKLAVKISHRPKKTKIVKRNLLISLRESVLDTPFNPVICPAHLRLQDYFTI